MNNLRIFAFILALALPNLAQATEQQMEMSFSPERPVLINSDLVLNPNTQYERKINKLWFMVAAIVYNPFDRPITIVALDFSHGLNQVTIGGTDVSNLPYIATIAPHTSLPLPSYLYVGGFGTSQTGTMELAVKVDVQGWFGTYTAPQERLNYSTTILTQ